MTSILAFLFVFGVLVTVHEWGHFIAAKKSGVLVREFAIGMGPKIVNVNHNHTAYTVRLLPVGGYVRMAGLDESGDLQAGQRILLTRDAQGIVTKINQQVDELGATGQMAIVDQFDLTDDLTLDVVINDERQRLAVSPEAVIVEPNGTTVQIAPRPTWFQSATLVKRALINIAGPLMNFLLAIVVFMGLGFAQPSVNLYENVVGTVTKQDPAAQAGVQPGDQITAINGKSTPDWLTLATTINATKGDLNLTIQRDGQQQTIQVTPKMMTQNGQQTSVIGITPRTHTDLSARLQFGFVQTWQVAKQVVHAIANLFTGGFSLDKLGGPVAIAQETSQAARAGWLTLLAFLGLLSVNLGLMNLLPIPALDGGKLILNAVELFYRKPLPEKFETAVTIAGAALLVLLMIAVTINDLLR
jgi:regulator of sigma E protease